MRYTLLPDFPHDTFFGFYSVAVTIYMPTHRTVSDQAHDKLVYKNLVKSVEKTIHETVDKFAAAAFIESLHALENDTDLWNKSTDGLAVFATPQSVGITRLKRPVKSQTFVGPRFYLKPLIQDTQSHYKAILLALDTHHFALYGANQTRVMPIQLQSDIAQTMEDALGHDYTETYYTHGVYANADNRSTFHGHGGSSAENELDQERFFRYVNQAVTDYYPMGDNTPVILVTVDEVGAEFRKHSTLPQLKDTSISGNFKDFTEKELLAHLDMIQEHTFVDHVTPLIDRYHARKKEDLSAPYSNLLMDALNEGRVETLLVEGDPDLDGAVDKKTQSAHLITTSDEAKRLNTMIHLAYAKGADVVVVNPDDMPDQAMAAGIFRYTH
jgi:hypothetical protein